MKRVLTSFGAPKVFGALLSHAGFSVFIASRTDENKEEERIMKINTWGVLFGEEINFLQTQSRCSCLINEGVGRVKSLETTIK